jgi:succinate dehydrogenase/fumarate reductase flavoprotein subunit
MKNIAIGKDRVTFDDGDGQHHMVEADNVIVAKGAVGNLTSSSSPPRRRTGS